MAKNRRRHQGRKLAVNVSAVNGSGTGDRVMSGDPGAVGRLPFVCLVSEDTVTGIAVVDTGGVYDLAVRGHDGAANAAIAVGETVFWDNTNGEIDKQTAGIPYGTALEAVASGATTTIEVRVGPANLA